MFILDGERDEDVVEAFRRYTAYLDEHRESFPPSALELATSDWYFDPADRRSPHDGWLEEAVLSEPSTGERHEVRRTALTIRLLGAYHEGHINLTYRDVTAYQLEGPTVSQGHRDWRYDEFRLGPRGQLVHEIEWSGGNRWIIEAEDVEYRWLPGPGV